MANHTVPIIGGAVVVALAAALWWTARDAPDAAVPEEVVETDAAVTVDRTALESETPSDAEPVAGPEANATADPGRNAAADPSPFATSDADEPTTPGSASITDTTAAPAAGSEDETSAAAGPDSGALDPSASDSADGTARTVVVPSSYPISDAAKYYVPPDERGPGNLGGPPPLDFPGGPNDPNREGGGFAPPAAPGQ